MNDIFIAVIGLTIIWQGYKLWQRQKELKDELAKMKDVNIEFGSGEGSGIEVVRKNYPQLELEDDPRTGLEEVKKDEA